jgi:hypothetical protein
MSIFQELLKKFVVIGLIAGNKLILNGINFG